MRRAPSGAGSGRAERRRRVHRGRRVPFRRRQEGLRVHLRVGRGPHRPLPLPVGRGLRRPQHGRQLLLLLTPSPPEPPRLAAAHGVESTAGAVAVGRAQSVCSPFRLRVPQSPAMAPFPTAARQTRRAVFPHRASGPASRGGMRDRRQIARLEALHAEHPELAIDLLPAELPGALYACPHFGVDSSSTQPVEIASAGCRNCQPPSERCLPRTPGDWLTALR